MEEIFNIALPIRFENSDKPQGTPIHLTKNGSPFLKSIGDFEVRDEAAGFDIRLTIDRLQKDE